MTWSPQSFQSFTVQGLPKEAVAGFLAAVDLVPTEYQIIQANGGLEVKVAKTEEDFGAVKAQLFESLRKAGGTVTEPAISAAK